MLLLGVIHADLKDGRPLVAEQRDRVGGGVQLKDAATAVLIPEQEVLVVAQAEGVIQLLALVHSLTTQTVGGRHTVNPETVHQYPQM